MALTPEDVRNKQFSTAKRKGYEMDEVDAFLDQIEIELGTLQRENAELKGRLAAAEQAAAVAPPAAAPVPAVGSSGRPAARGAAAAAVAVRGPARRRPALAGLTSRRPRRRSGGAFVVLGVRRGRG